MAAGAFRVPRVEGGVSLEADGAGRLRLRGDPTRDFERRLLNRSPLDAVFMVQQISADGGVSHALASVSAWEAAAGMPVSENGRVLREILHALSIIHAHLRQFYLQALPDYLPPATLSRYQGRNPAVLRIKPGPESAWQGDWRGHDFSVPLTPEETDLLWEHRVQGLRVMGVLRRMIALVGGKFPVVMSFVPGGISTPLNLPDLFAMRNLLAEVGSFIRTVPIQDGLLLLERFRDLGVLGAGVSDFLSVGSEPDATAAEGAIFPSGVWISNKLEPFGPSITESLHEAYYGIPLHSAGGGGVAGILPGKVGAYSWIKAPRYLERPMETGPLARLLIAYLSGGRMWRANLVESLETALGQSLRQAGSVGGRMLARLAELEALADRVDSLLDQVDPAHPMVNTEGKPLVASGEGRGMVESAGGALLHTLILKEGRIVHYDILSPSTWNGSSPDERGEQGPLETALNQRDLDMSFPEDRLSASRIVHSFAFSMSDAVQ